MRITIALLGLALTATSVAEEGKWEPLSLKDLSVYTKVKSNLDGQWQHELGLFSRLTQNGHFWVVSNVDFLATYPLKTPFPAQWGFGLTAGYRLAATPFATSVYSKTKSNFKGLWQQETGLTKLIYGQGGGKIRVLANGAYIYSYPYKSGRAPIWTVGLSLIFRLR